VNFDDQRVYRIGGSREVGESTKVGGLTTVGGSASAFAKATADKSRDTPYVRAQPVTPTGAWRYADFDIDTRRQRLICVREDHTQEGREPINTLVSIPTGPAEAGHYDRPPRARHYEGPLSAGHVLVSGAHFYSTPRLSPDGTALLWLSWNHPSMPWDGTELWVAPVDASGALGTPERVAGGPNESIYQPGWAPDGTLYYVSDRTGWWQIYRAVNRPNANGANGASDPNNPDESNAWNGSNLTNDPNTPNGSNDLNVTNDPRVREAEFGRPQWVFGTSTWACAGPADPPAAEPAPQTLVVSYARGGTWHLATIDVTTGTLTGLATDWQPHDWLAANATHAVFVAGSATRPDAVLRLDLRSGSVESIREASTAPLDDRSISVAQAIAFPTTLGRTAHAFYYPPRSADFVAPAGERPPLIVISHGGPTAAAQSTLDLQIQYWTSRGFEVVDVNYGGSSGYGRAYRERLNGQWGIVDVDDVISAARYLVAQGKADGARLAIRGGSAGGYTTLAALTFRPDVFKAGASYYGISDLEALELDTHKFESRYSSSLIGPYPEARETYRERSPIHALDRLACPLILFQGLEDKVVPPNQSQMMADAVRAKGLPVAYLAFEGEQHGFRKAETIVRCLEAELYFYGAVFGFRPADPIPPVPIDNL
jgi:dienelactone hydrolase